MKKLALLTSIVLFIAINGCKKEKVEDPPKTTAQKIQGKWNITSIIEKEVSTNGTFTNNHSGTSGEYVEFKTDGKVYTKRDGQSLESLTYTVNSDTQITIDGDVHDIKTLTENSFVIYHKSTFQSGYNEITVTLSK
ncbi:MAG: hypothetical protein J7577_01055 [Sphingobacteriaceae bacterium]|nr:hypothetical protein [Sphingobacteriaceae bacterium]